MTGVRGSIHAALLSNTPRNKTATPARAPTAPVRAFIVRLGVWLWAKAANPAATTNSTLTPRVALYAVELEASVSSRFQMPVTNATANAGHATLAKPVAAALVASEDACSSLRRRRPGTTPANTNWPPTQIDAERTWRNTRIVSRFGESTQSP